MPFFFLENAKILNYILYICIERIIEIFVFTIDQVISIH